MLKDTDTSIYNNLLCNYLFNKAYDIQGNHGFWKFLLLNK